MWIRPALLFVATCATTWQSRGPIFAATLMAILVTHELGHYLAARRHGIPVSLAYFIPLPFIGIGTLGAIIRMKAPIEDRNALVDVGAAGPLAGLVVAIPLLVIGLLQSPVGVLPFEAGASQMRVLVKEKDRELARAVIERAKRDSIRGQLHRRRRLAP